MTPAQNQYGTAQVIITTTDSAGALGKEQIVVSVTPVNDAPTTVADTGTVAESGTVLLSVLANDADIENNTLSITSVSQASTGTVTISGSQLRYTAPQNTAGTATFSYTISDGNGGTATGSVVVTIICADGDGDGYCASVDCDNSNDLLHPATIWYSDEDGDGFSDGSENPKCLDPGATWYLSSQLIGTANTAYSLNLTSGLVGHWSFDSNDGDDDSGNGNHGTLAGGL